MHFQPCFKLSACLNTTINVCAVDKPPVQPFICFIQIIAKTSLTHVWMQCAVPQHDEAILNVRHITIDFHINVGSHYQFICHRSNEDWGSEYLPALEELKLGENSMSHM